MLVTKEVEVGLSSINTKYYEKLGYKIPRRIDKYGINCVKRGTKIRVKTQDLQDRCNSLVDVICDGCEKTLNIKWSDYKRSVKENGECYCFKCGNAGHKKWVSFYEWCYLNLSKEDADRILSRWDYDLNGINPIDVTYSSKGLNGKGYWFKCLTYHEHGSELRDISNFTSGEVGSICCTKCNKIAVTNPDLVDFFVDKEDVLKYSSGSEKSTLIRCPECEFQNKRIIKNFIRYGINCPKCSDGVPYPEKFMFSVLCQLDIIFKTQLSKSTFEWCGKYQYDNFISEINCIIETHGLQHYEENANWKMSLDKTQENDKLKEQNAKDNNIGNYIVLDCRYSQLEWIKNSIMHSEIPRLLNFKEEDINWLQCSEYACKNMVKEACNLWNSGINKTIIIADKLRISRATVLRYLKQGAELKWCKYINHSKVICLTTNEIFNTQTEASRKYNMYSSSDIAQCCRHNRPFSGKHPDTGEKLVWMYYGEYLSIT